MFLIETKESGESLITNVKTGWSARLNTLEAALELAERLKHIRMSIDCAFAKEKL